MREDVRKRGIETCGQLGGTSLLGLGFFGYCNIQYNVFLDEQYMYLEDFIKRDFVWK